MSRGSDRRRARRQAINQLLADHDALSRLDRLDRAQRPRAAESPPPDDGEKQSREGGSELTRADPSASELPPTDLSGTVPPRTRLPAQPSRSGQPPRPSLPLQLPPQAQQPSRAVPQLRAQQEQVPQQQVQHHCGNDSCKPGPREYPRRQSELAVAGQFDPSQN